MQEIQSHKKKPGSKSRHCSSIMDAQYFTLTGRG